MPFSLMSFDALRVRRHMPGTRLLFRHAALMLPPFRCCYSYAACCHAADASLPLADYACC